MICFFVGIILGIYLCKYYDLERIFSDVKSNIFKCECGFWQYFRNVEKKYRKNKQESNNTIVACETSVTMPNTDQSSAPTSQQIYPTFALGSNETHEGDTLKDK